MSENIVSLALPLAALIEAVVTNISWAVEGKFDWKRITALVLSVIVTTLAGIDVFAFVGLKLLVSYVGAALTGIILARGANGLNDLLNLLKALRNRSV